MVSFKDTARSVLVVTIGAMDQPLVYAMVKRHIELSPLLQVAGIAKPGLGPDQHVFLSRCMVHRVAGGTAKVVLPVECIRSTDVVPAWRVAREGTVPNWLSACPLLNRKL